MIRIDLNKTFYDVTKDNALLKEAFIELGFVPMKNMAAYQTIGKTITIKKALEHIQVSIEDAQKFLEQKEIEVEFYE